METGIMADASTRRVRCPACGHTSRGQIPVTATVANITVDLRCKRCGWPHAAWRKEAGKWQGKEKARKTRKEKARASAKAAAPTINAGRFAAWAARLFAAAILGAGNCKGVR